MQITKPPPQKILCILEKSVVLQRDSWLQISKKKKKEKVQKSFDFRKSIKTFPFLLKHSAATLEKKQGEVSRHNVIIFTN